MEALEVEVTIKPEADKTFGGKKGHVKCRLGESLLVEFEQEVAGYKATLKYLISEVNGNG